MASAAYTAWLAEFATSRVTLAELQPAQLLSVWASTGGGHTNVYQAAFASVTETDVVAGGVYRRLDSVKQNDVALASRASLAALDAAADGYFFDDAASLLYVKTTSGASPATFSAMLAFFTVFVATEPIDFVGGRLYEPRLTGALPTVALSSEDPLFGIKQYSSGSVTLSNADKLFDKLARKWVWKNKLVTLRFGGGSLAFSDYETVAVMRVEDATPDDDTFVLTLRQMAGILEKTWPLNTITAAAYPQVGDGVEGTYRPILYGVKTDIAPPLVDKTAGAQTYLVTDPQVRALASVQAVRAVNSSTGAVTTLTLGVDYALALASGGFTVTNAAYDAGSYQIRCDATGYGTTCGQMALDLITQLGESSANIDAASFAAADAACIFPLGLWAREPQSAAAYVRLVEQSVLGTLFVGRDGLWRFDVWDPTYVVGGVPALADEDISDWSVDDKLETIFPTARVKFDQSPATGDWSETSSTDAAVQYAYESTDVAIIETALLQATDAQTIAQRYRMLAGSPTINVTIKERGLSQMTAQPFDKVLVTRARAPHSSGAYAAQVMEVLKVTKQLAPPAVTVVLGDLRGFGARVGRWADTAAPDWAAATTNERDRDGYWSDSSGLIDPADSATADQSIWY